MSRRIRLVLAVVLSVAVASGVYRFRWGVLGLAGLGPPSRACEKVEALETYLRAGGSPSAYVGRKPLIACAAQAGNYEVVARLIELDVDVNERTASHPIPIIMNEDIGFTALHFAVSEGYFEIVELLFENDADISLTGKISPYSPLDYALIYNKPQILKLFLTANGAKSKLNDRWISGVASKGYIEIFEILFEEGIEFKKAYEKSLISAALSNRVEIVKLLVSEGVDINSRGLNGLTALHFSARDGHIEVVRSLLESGAKIDILDDNAKTPLDYAIEHEHLDVVDALVKNKNDASQNQE